MKNRGNGGLDRAQGGARGMVHIIYYIYARRGMLNKGRMREEGGRREPPAKDGGREKGENENLQPGTAGGRGGRARTSSQGRLEGEGKDDRA